MEQDNPMTAPAPKPDGVDVDELERLAKAAGGARWTLVKSEGPDDPRCDVYHERGAWVGEVCPHWAEFVAAAHPAAVLALVAERDALRAENERLWANTGVGGCAGDAPEEMYVSGLATHGCDAWIHLVRVEVIKGEVNERQAAKIAGGLYTQPVRYVRADVAEAERDALRRAVEGLPKTKDGVPIVPGMVVYGPRSIEVALLSGGRCQVHELRVLSVTQHGDWFATTDRDYARCGNNYYSTREAALATPGAGTGDGGGATKGQQ